MEDMERNFNEELLGNLKYGCFLFQKSNYLSLKQYVTLTIIPRRTLNRKHFWKETCKETNRFPYLTLKD